MTPPAFVTSVWADPQKFNRVIATVVAFVWPIIGPFLAEKLGIKISVEQALAGSAALAVWVYQSGHHSALVNAAKVGVDAAAAVKDVGDAKAVFGEVKP